MSLIKLPGTRIQVDKSDTIIAIVAVCLLIIPFLIWFNNECNEAHKHIIPRMEYTGSVKVNAVFVVGTEQHSNSIILDGPGAGRTCESSRPLGHEGAVVNAFIHGLDYLVCE